MSSDQNYKFPEFWSYPPYFTVQPIPETLQKQKELWRSLIVDYCRHARLFQINVDDTTDVPPFANPAINRRLNRDAKVTFLDELVANGQGLWLDGKTKRTFIVLWKTLNDWADTIYAWAMANGHNDDVVLVEDLKRKETVGGTELDSLHPAVLEKALKALETQGKAKLFTGASPDEEGVKFK